MLMRLVGVAGVVMIVRPVIPGVVVIVGVGIGPVGMFVLMLVQMLVGVAMGMLVAVGFIPVAVFVGMGVAMVVVVQMLVFVLAFHGFLLFEMTMTG